VDIPILCTETSRVLVDILHFRSINPSINCTYSYVFAMQQSGSEQVCLESLGQQIWIMP